MEELGPMDQIISHGPTALLKWSPRSTAIFAHDAGKKLGFSMDDGSKGKKASAWMQDH